MVRHKKNPLNAHIKINSTDTTKPSVHLLQSIVALANILQQLLEFPGSTQNGFLSLPFSSKKLEGAK